MTECISECGGRLGSGSEKSGVITVGVTDPAEMDENNIPYDRFQTCLWHITVPKKHKIQMQFDRDFGFNVEYHNFCGFDKLHVISGLYGPNEQFDRIARFCGPRDGFGTAGQPWDGARNMYRSPDKENMPFWDVPYTFENNKVSIGWDSDQTKTTGGFRLKWWAVEEERSRRTKDQLLIDRAVLKEARVKKRWLAMAWVDYKKAYDMLPHSWICESLHLVKVAKNLSRLVKGSMGDWRTVLTANGERLGEVRIRRGIFQGDSLSPLLFIVAMLPLTMILKRETALGYKFGREKKRMNHLLFMDDLKLYAENRLDLEELIGIVQRFSKDIGMEFGVDKCAVLEIKGGMKAGYEGIELPDGQTIKVVDDGGINI